MSASEVKAMDQIFRSDVDRMIADWQRECKDHPALHNQGNVLRDRLKDIPARVPAEELFSPIVSRSWERFASAAKDESL